MKFEKLDVWKRSVKLSVAVYRGMRSCPDNGFKHQITRASLAVPSNIAEGLERLSNRETARFLDIAKSSCAEFYTQALIGVKVGLIDPELGNAWKQEAREISAMIGGLIKHVAPSLETSN